MNKSKAIKEYIEFIIQSLRHAAACGFVCGPNTIMLSFRFHFVYISALPIPIARPAGGAINTTIFRLIIKINRREIWKRKIPFTADRWMCFVLFSHAAILICGLWLQSVTEMAQNIPTVNNIAATNDLISYTLEFRYYVAGSAIINIIPQHILQISSLRVSELEHCEHHQPYTVCLIHPLFNQAQSFRAGPKKKMAT